MICDCGNSQPHALRIRYEGEKRFVSCDGCSGGFVRVPDIYFAGTYTDPHLSSEQFPGPKLIRSRQEKKYWMDKCNLREAGDRVHGATTFDKRYHQIAMESLRKKGFSH